MSSLISVIRAAVRPGQLPDSIEEGEADATASIPATPLPEAIKPGGDMSANQTAPGAAAAVAGTLAAVAAAAQGGDADGYKAATDRMNAVLSADGIKGDAQRMSAALELASASPAMAADAVVAFVTANVPAAKLAAADNGQNYEQRRLAAASLAQPSASLGNDKPKATLSASAIYDARRQATKGA